MFLTSIPPTEGKRPRGSVARSVAWHGIARGMGLGCTKHAACAELCQRIEAHTWYSGSGWMEQACPALPCNRYCMVGTSGAREQVLPLPHLSSASAIRDGPDVVPVRPPCAAGHWASRGISSCVAALWGQPQSLKAAVVDCEGGVTQRPLPPASRCCAGCAGLAGLQQQACLQGCCSLQ
jgi:hypothetical protein